MDNKKRLRLLQSIANSIRKIRAEDHSPLKENSYQGLTIGLAAGMGMAVTVATKASEAMSGYGFPMLFSFALAGVLIARRMTKYRTWEERVYGQLMEYQPVNEEKFRQLRERIALEEFFSQILDLIQEFVIREMALIAPRKLTKEELARKQFLDTELVKEGKGNRS